jgi:hypothetical protein
MTMQDDNPMKPAPRPPSEELKKMRTPESVGRHKKTPAQEYACIDCAWVGSSPRSGDGCNFCPICDGPAEPL